jgi:Protein of unknown function (DUF2493).
MRVLICGSRNYDDKETLNLTLDGLRSIYTITDVIEGEARGADTLARLWAESHGLSVHPFPADWKKHGKAAGYIRNRQMLDEGKPELIVAFSKDILTSSGTHNMICLGNKARVPVFLYS